jgi:DNA-directed RNA polymerase beta' subunit/intein/homing endonuclease
MSIYPELSYTDQKVDIQNVKGIQFSVLGPDEIIARSAVEVYRTDTYNGNEPVVGGLFDSRMGVLEHNKICSTCEQKNVFCPGHFGHIKLAKPVFHAMFFDITKKILKCVCYRCSKLLISPDTTNPDLKADIQKIVSIKDNQTRWNAYFKLCNTNTKIKCCGDDGSIGCNARQPSKYNKDGPMKIVAEWKDKATTEDTVKTVLEFTAEDVLRIFKRISEEDMELMGFNPKWNRPDWMICTVLPVPPPAVRPSIIEENGQRREDDLTHKLSEIIKANNAINERITKGSSEEHIKLVTMVLQYHIFTLIDNQIPGLAPSQQRNGRRLKSVSDRMKKKEGRIRGNLNGKRVDQSARTVITPDPYISIDELGVPVKIALNITFPEVVNEYNIEHLRKLITNGPDNWPGAKYVKKASDAVTINLKYAQADVEKIVRDLKYGDTVHRHLADGDYILFNRQPSLHKMSMMCHKVIVMPYQTFRLNVLDTPPYNADFDGDEMNLHCPQNIQTMSELMDIAAVPYMVIASRDGKPIIEIVQDTLLGSFRLTKDHTEIGDKTMANLQMVNSYFSGKLEKPDKKYIYNGKQAYSQILPPGLNINRKNKAEEKFVIQNSQVISGSLDKVVFHSMTSGLIPVIFHDYGPFEVKKFLDNTQRLICRWLLTAGFSVGISDLVTDAQTDENLKNKIKEMKTKAYQQLDEVRRGMIENNSIFSNEEYMEREIIGILNETTNQVGKIGLSQIDEKSNRMLNMVKSGSKGKETNVAQIIACVGQQNVDGRRINYGFTDRTLPHFTKYDDGPDARGFVENSFISGLSPQEVFFHAMGGREGLIDTAVKSVTGDSPIIVIEDGVSKYVTIGEWVDAKIDDPANKHLVEQFGPEDMNMEMLGVPDGLYIPACDEVGNVAWGKLTNVSRHDPGENLFEVTTESGRSLVVTASKSLIVWRNGKFEKIFTPLAEVGDCLPLIMNLPTPPVVTKYIDMTKYFPKTEYVYGTDFHLATRMMKEAQGSKFHIPKGWWEQNNGVAFTVPYPNKARFQRVNSGRSNTENIKEGFLYPYSATRCCSHFPEKFELNMENGIFIGLFLADGNANIPSGCIGITKEEESVRAWMRNWFDNYGITHRDTVKIVPENDEGLIVGKTTTLVGSTRLWGQFLTAILDTHAKSKHIPDVAFTASDEFVLGLLNGYFSGDGCVAKNFISVSSASYKLIEGISALCARIGVVTKITRHQPTTTNLRGNFKPSVVNTLKIQSKWVHVFASKINLINAPKQEKLQKLLQLVPKKQYQVSNNCVLDPIKEIRVLPQADVQTKYKKVYDVTVPELGTFSLANLINVMNTSDTGYIERRLVKAMEDVKIYYDNTVRNAGGSIIQYIYGEDGMDGSKIETQFVSSVDMNTIDIELNHHLRKGDRLQHHLTDKAVKEITQTTYERCTQHYKQIVEDKFFLINRVFNGSKSAAIKFPIPFDRIIKNAYSRLSNAGIKGMKSDMSPDYILDAIDNLSTSLYIKDTEQGTMFFQILLRLYLSPKKILLEYHFTRDVFDWIVSQIQQYYKEAIAQPGEMVGIVAAQTIGEMGTQMTLDSFHVSGTEAAVKATSGVPRLKEILSATKKTKTPTLIIYMKHDIATVVNPVMAEDGIETDDPRVEKAKSIAINIKNSIEITRLSDILEYNEIYWDNGKYETSIEKDKGMLEIYKELSELDQYANKCKSNSPWVLRMKFNKEKMKSYGLRMIDIYTKLNLAYDKYIDCIYSDDNAEECIFRIKLTDAALKDIDSKDAIAAVKAMEHNIVYQVLLKGYKGIKKVSLNKKKYDKYNKETQTFDKVIEWVLDTDGTNLTDILANPNLDSTRTISNDIREIYETLGIEAARNALHNELINVTSEGSMNYRHLSLLIDTMTYKGYLMSIDRHGINRGDIGPLAKSSFEETTDMLINASIFSEYDNVNGVSANVMLGQQPPCGTGDCNILLDEEHFIELMKDKMPLELDAIKEEDEEEQYTQCLEEDIAFNFKLKEPHKCYQLEEQKIKIV